MVQKLTKCAKRQTTQTHFCPIFSGKTLKNWLLQNVPTISKNYNFQTKPITAAQTHILHQGTNINIINQKMYILEKLFPKITSFTFEQ